MTNLGCRQQQPEIQEISNQRYEKFEIPASFQYVVNEQIQQKNYKLVIRYPNWVLLKIGFFDTIT